MTRANTAPEFVDAEARRVIMEELHETLWVEASAGTGKTTALVRRIVALIEQGVTTLAQMVSVTFTEKAAGEMKLRLRAQLERARAGAEGVVSERLEEALRELEAARIGTIHSLAADILHERPLEAQVDPVFGVNATGANGTVFRTAFDGWFQRVLEDPPEGVRRILRRPRSYDPRHSPRETLMRAGWRLVDNRDFQTPWVRREWDRAAAIEALLPDIRALGLKVGEAYDREDYLARNLDDLRRFTDELQARERVAEVGAQRDYDGIEAQLIALNRGRSWRWRGRGRFYGNGILRSEVLAARDALKERLDDFVSAAGADLAACVRSDLKPLLESYEALKQRTGELDFLDLLIRTRDLVRDDRTVRSQLQERFSHLFVDEFQDTDPLQAEILLLLSADDPRQTDWRDVRPKPGKLFVVGDPKQSIYRFRRADVALYERLKAQLAERGARVLQLSTSFRSVPDIQRAINASFAVRMLGGESQATYVDLSPHRDEIGGQPSVVALPVPKPYASYGKLAAGEVGRSLPKAVGAWVRWLVDESGWHVEENHVSVPVEPRHVCLLFRRFQSFGDDVTRPYVQALEAQGLPHVLVGGHSFHQRDEVLAVRNALTAIEWPDDELSVFATLVGPLFAIGNDAVLLWKQTIGTVDPLRPVDDDVLAESELLMEVAEGLDVLKRLHVARNRRPIADTVDSLLELTRAHAGFAVTHAGRQALANVLRTVDLARRFESDGATSFRAFVEQLQEDAERGEASDAPIVEEGSDGVRIMTVHRAKGLEFPVVILCDPLARLSTDKPTLYVNAEQSVWAAPLAGCTPAELVEHATTAIQRDEEEGVRLAYVAATRARDVLVVPTFGDDELNGWYSPLNPSVYPMWANARQSAPAVGCPPFGDETVLHRPVRAATPPNGSVRPGEHQPRAGTHQVVWWDPHVLSLDIESGVGVAHQAVLEQGPGEETSRERWDAFLDASEARRDAAAAPSTPSVSVSQWIHRDGEPSAPSAAGGIEWQRVPGRPMERPHGTRFGILVHEALATLPFDADSATVAQVVRGRARRLGASAEEATAAISSVQGVMSSPFGQEIAASPRCLREHPFVLIEGEETIEGVIDLCFEDPAGGWVVVDYKTDLAVAAEARARYEAQVAMYCRAVQNATGENARGVLLQV